MRPWLLQKIGGPCVPPYLRISLCLTSVAFAMALVSCNLPSPKNFSTCLKIAQTFSDVKFHVILLESKCHGNIHWNIHWKFHGILVKCLKRSIILLIVLLCYLSIMPLVCNSGKFQWKLKNWSLKISWFYCFFSLKISCHISTDIDTSPFT